MITKNRFFRVFSKEAIFLSLYPLLFFPAHAKIFPCPRKNFCVGREKNIPGQGSDFFIVIKWDF